MQNADVAIVSLYPPPASKHAGRSGVASYTANLAKGLVDAGAAVDVVCPYDPEEEPIREHDGPVYVRRTFRRGATALVDAVAAAKATRAPVVHVQFELFLYGGTLALLGLMPALAALRNAGRRVVVTPHQVVDPSTIDRGFVRTHRVRSPSLLARAGINLVQNAIGRLADAVVVHEPSFKNQITGSAVIRHGVESRQRLDAAKSRQELGLGSRPVVLCFGFIAPYKGLEAALSAAELSERFELVVAGGEHPRLSKGSTQSYAAELQQRWPNTARFTGYVPETDIAKWFSAADLALFPYPKPFASSGALALALSYGTPVVVSEAVARCIEAPELLTVPLEPTELAQELDRVVSDYERMRSIRTACAQLTAGRSWPATARAHLDLYEEVLNAHGPVGRSVRAG